VLLKHHSISAFIVIAWTVVWLSAIVALAYFWSSLPAYVAWPLSLLSLMLVPDIAVLKDLVSEFLRGSNRP